MHPKPKKASVSQCIREVTKARRALERATQTLEAAMAREGMTPALPDPNSIPPGTQMIGESERDWILREFGARGWKLPTKTDRGERLTGVGSVARHTIVGTLNGETPDPTNLSRMKTVLGKKFSENPPKSWLFPSVRQFKARSLSMLRHYTSLVPGLHTSEVSKYLTEGGIATFGDLSAAEEEDIVEMLLAGRNVYEAEVVGRGGNLDEESRDWAQRQAALVKSIKWKRFVD